MTPPLLLFFVPASYGELLQIPFFH